MAHILGATHALGESLLTLLHASAGVQVHPEDQTTREELAGHAQEVKQKVRLYSNRIVLYIIIIENLELLVRYEDKTASGTCTGGET